MLPEACYLFFPPLCNNGHNIAPKFHFLLPYWGEQLASPRGHPHLGLVIYSENVNLCALIQTERIFLAEIIHARSPLPGTAPQMESMRRKLKEFYQQHSRTHWHLMGFSCPPFWHSKTFFFQSGAFFKKKKRGGTWRSLGCYWSRVVVLLSRGSGNLIKNASKHKEAGDGLIMCAVSGRQQHNGYVRLICIWV